MQLQLWVVANSLVVSSFGSCHGIVLMVLLPWHFKGSLQVRTHIKGYWPKQQSKTQFPLQNKSSKDMMDRPPIDGEDIGQPHVFLEPVYWRCCWALVGAVRLPGSGGTASRRNFPARAKALPPPSLHLHPPPPSPPQASFGGARFMHQPHQHEQLSTTYVAGMQSPIFLPY